MATNIAALPTDRRAASRGSGTPLAIRLREVLNGVQISSGVAALLSVNIVLLLSVCALFFMVRSADTGAENALRFRAERLEIANELGRATSQMSRVARGYAVTGEDRYRRLYGDMLAIREGRRARPRDYPRTYWDLVIAGRPQKADGRAISILALAKEAGFDEAGMRIFERAKHAGDALIAVEQGAMRSTPEVARDRLFSREHILGTAAVMDPLDTLLIRVADGSKSSVADAQARASGRAAWFLATLCLAAVVALLSSWVFVFRVVRPLCRLSAVMARIARDPGDVPIPFTDRHDEIGRMAYALHAFRVAMEERDRLRDAEHRTARRRDEEASGHARALTEAAARNSRAVAVEALVHGFTGDLLQAMDAVQDATSELNECAQTMTLVAHGTERRVVEAEESGRETAAHVDTVASTCRQLARATGEIEAQTGKSIASADRAVDVVRKTGATVDALRLNSDRIQGIVTLIGQIATKTNRLAINATIEAAHAGPAGRGFSVVAAEVKSLARQTAAAAGEISDQLGAVRAASYETVLMVDDIALSIAESREISLAIGSAVERQSSATGAISKNADRAAESTRQSAASMATIRVTTGHTHAAIGRMIGAASALSGTGAVVNSAVDRFADEVRSV